MTDVWIDPPELDAMGSLISEQAQRLEVALAGGLGLDGLDLPAHLGWVRETAADLARETATIGVAYLLNGVDVLTRAAAVRAEQATATTVAAPTGVETPGLVLAGSSQVDPGASTGGTGLVGGTFLGATSTGPLATTYASLTSEAFAAHNPLLTLPGAIGTNAFGTGGFDSNDAIRQTLTGVPWRNGRPVDDWGSNDHGSGSIEPDPTTGRPRVRP